MKTLPVEYRHRFLVDGGVVEEMPVREGQIVVFQVPIRGSVVSLALLTLLGAGHALPMTLTPSAYGATRVSTKGPSGFSGTSNATPTVAGTYARALYLARRAMPGASKVQSRGLIARGSYRCGVRMSSTPSDCSRSGAPVVTIFAISRSSVCPSPAGRTISDRCTGSCVAPFPSRTSPPACAEDMTERHMSPATSRAIHDEPIDAIHLRTWPRGQAAPVSFWFIFERTH